MERSNLRVVFDECSKRGILTSLNESCCDTCNTCTLDMELKKHPECFGYVYSHAQTVDNVMEELLEEGSSTIFFGFDGRTDKDLKKTGYALASILKKYGYIVDWNEKMTRKIAVVIEETDLPPGFKDKWLKTHEAYMEAYPDEGKDDPPPIAAFKRASRKTYLNDFEEKKDTGEKADTEEEKEAKTEDIIDQDEDEERDQETEDQEGTKIEDVIGQEEDLGEDEDEEEDDLSSIPTASDIENEGDDSIPECESDCECVNCVAERDEE